jgi:rod shape-determining protein MreD
MSLQLGLPLVFLGALIQGSVLSQLRVFGGQPDLVVLIVLAWSALDAGQEGMVWAFFGGLFLDLLSGIPLGISSLALVPLAFIIGLTEAQVYRTNILLLLVLLGGGALAYHLIYMFLLRFIINYPLSFQTGFFYITLPSILFDLILILPVLRILGHWYDRLHPDQVSI